MIVGLIRLILLGYNGWMRHMKRSKIISRPRIMLIRYSVVQKLSNKHRDNVVLRLVGLIKL